MQLPAYAYPADPSVLLPYLKQIAESLYGIKVAFIWFVAIFILDTVFGNHSK